jgi:release factor glutamine methyltransferase
VSPLSGATVRDALDGAVTAIGASGSPTARLDAELLLAHALGTGRERLVMEPDAPVEGDAVHAFRDLVTRRAAGEPVAYLLGTRGFRHIDLAVDPRVLVPRPETELLVEAALGLDDGARVLDVGTGSGAVALALKDERPHLEVTGADLSDDALAVARANAERLGLDVAFVRADLLDGLGEEWDAILANPPYVAETDRETLPRDVREHEPDLALFAGADGLAVIRRLVPAAGATQARLLAIEVGAGQSEDVREFVREAGFRDVQARRDLAGIERVVVGRR